MVLDAATDENGTGTKPEPGTEPPLSRSHKLLKTHVPNELLYDFIKKIAHKMPNSDCFLIDLFAYKKATYFEGVIGTSTSTSTENDSPSQSLLQKFCQDLMPYYCKDKQLFLTRKMSYNKLNTILRQICRHNSIDCRSERIYDKSKTHIVYYIHDEMK
jgi:hypothetical protein